VPDFLARLTSADQSQLLEEMNYMNLEEIRGFCAEHAIPYRIVIAYPDGTIKATKDIDRKPLVPAHPPLPDNRRGRAADLHSFEDCPRRESTGPTRRARSSVLPLVRQGTLRCPTDAA
jgi:hypothetical protein